MCKICSIRNGAVSKTEIEIATDGYESLYAVWRKDVLFIEAYGEGCPSYNPKFCPECGRKVNE